VTRRTRHSIDRGLVDELFWYPQGPALKRWRARISVFFSSNEPFGVSQSLDNSRSRFVVDINVRRCGVRILDNLVAKLDLHLFKETLKRVRAKHSTEQY
jgi:hypothetical protein